MKGINKSKNIGITFFKNHFKNAVVRFFTNDKYYVCEECSHIHKRDGSELRLDKDDNLAFNPIWYGSVNYDCYAKQQMKVVKLLRDSLLG